MRGFAILRRVASCAFRAERAPKIFWKKDFWFFDLCAERTRLSLFLNSLNSSLRIFSLQPPREFFFEKLSYRSASLKNCARCTRSSDLLRRSSSWRTGHFPETFGLTEEPWGDSLRVSSDSSRNLSPGLKYYFNFYWFLLLVGEKFPPGPL